jgi:negative regulator of sigma E activity
MINEQLEFLIAQYADGTIGEMDRRIVDERLAVDAEARLLLEQYRHVDTLMRNSREVPDIDFGRFRAHISDLIAEEEAPVAHPIRMHSTWTWRLAVAAGVVLVVGMGLHLMPPGSGNGAPEGTMVVSGPTVEKAQQPGSMNIAVGPTQAMADRGMTLGMADDVMTTPSPRVSISAANQPPMVDDRLY